MTLEMTNLLTTARIGWIGTGVMGRAMCENLLKNAQPGAPTPADLAARMSVFTRTPSKADSLVEMGAYLARSPKELAERSDVVFSIVGYPEDVREVVLGDNGALSGLKSGAILIDMTTSQPSLAREIAKVAQSKGVMSVDAPVSGGDVGAKNATLSVMLGGNEATVTALQPLLQRMAKNIVYMGGPGMGQHTKMANQILICSGMVGLVEGLSYAHKAGLDLNTVISAVEKGAAGSWSLSNYGPRMVKRNFDPGFFVDHFVKDLGIALQEAAAMKLSLPGLAMAHQLYVSLQAQGHGRKGTHSLLLAFERMNESAA